MADGVGKMARDVIYGVEEMVHDVVRFEIRQLHVIYVICVFFGLLYFWEGGPWHSSRRTEVVYLEFLVFFPLVLSTLLWYHSLKELAVAELTTVFITIAVFLLCIWYFIVSMAQRNDNTKFFDVGGNRERLKQPPQTKEGLMLARLIGNTVERFKKQPIFLASPAPLCFTVAFFIMLSNISRHVPCQAIKWIVGAVGVFWFLESQRYMNDYACYVASNKIYKLFKGLVASRDAQTMAYVLSRIDLTVALYITSWNTSTPLVELLTEDALRYNMLDMTSKAILLDALSNDGMGSKGSQIAVKLLICSTFGKELTLVKNLIDGSGRHDNFYKLVYIDITRAYIRDEVVEHVAAEALALRSALRRPAGIKVLSDIDDTLFCSGGFPAGCDKQYSKHTGYPGCCNLYHALTSNNLTMDQVSVDVVFLSARPHVYKDVTESGSYSTFEELVKDGILNSTPTLLPGRLLSSMLGALLYPCQKNWSWRRAGEAKFETFVKYKKLYQEYDFIFSGDDGQGDLLAGQRMLEIEETDGDDDAFGGASHSTPQVRAVLIHKVLQANLSPLALEHSDKESLGYCSAAPSAEQRLVFHRTYVGAAVDLAQGLQLLSAEQVRHVANCAISQFEISQLDPAWDTASREEAKAELHSDLQRAAVFVQSAGLPPLAVLPDYIKSDILETSDEAVLHSSDEGTSDE